MVSLYSSLSPLGHPRTPLAPVTRSPSHVPTFPLLVFDHVPLWCGDEHEIGRRTETFLQLESPDHRLLPD